MMLLIYLVKKGFDSKMGARPLQRVIDKDVKRPLSREMLFGSLKDGGAVEIDVDSSGIKLKVKENAFEENY
jgi:ATP-dependent Clp protease ATP-binding subunit ClpA